MFIYPPFLGDVPPETGLGRVLVIGPNRRHNAITASDKVIAIVSPGYFELDSIVQISKTNKEVREYFDPSLELLGFLFTMSDPTINTSTSIQTFRQTYTDKVSRQFGITNWEDGQDRYCPHLIFGDASWQNNTTPSLDLEKIAGGTSPMLL